MPEETQESKVYVKLDTVLKDFTGQKDVCELAIEGHISVKSLLVKVGIPLEAVGFVILNGQMIKLDQEIKNGDNLHVFPIIEGG